MRSRTLLAAAGGLAFLSSTATTTAQIRVGLCAAASATNTACQWVDVQNTLLATTQFSAVDIINVGTATPTLAQLLTYDALMCWTNTTPLDFNAWGDVLADYVDAGGGVVVTVFANSSTTTGRHIGGRWQNGYEVVLDQGGSTSGAGGVLGTVSLPLHPVMAGVSAFAGGTLGSRPTSTALEVGSTLIASWNTGHVLVAEGRSPQRIDLGFYPPNAVCSQSGWTVGGDLLMTNALLYVAHAASFSPFGAGCTGSLGVPTLTNTGNNQPTLGSAYSLTVGNIPAVVGIMAIGFSNQQSGPFALPLDLSPFAMPGCSLLTDILSSSLLLAAGTDATWVLNLPVNPNVLGTVFFNQAFVLDPAANPQGLTTSNAGVSRIGS